MTPAQGPGPVLQDRLAAFALVALAVGAGLAAFWLGGAPAAYLPVNAAALGLAAAAFLIPGERSSTVLRTLILIAAPLLIGATFLIGPEVLGVHRWIALGPLRLHPGSLLLPALVTVAALQSDRAALAVVAVCAGLVWLQPDFASAMALALGTMFAFVGRQQTPTEHAARLIAALAMVFTAFRPDPLGPVPFVETALADGWRINSALGLAMAGSLALALAAPPWLLTRASPERRRAAAALTGALIGLTIPSLLGSYPQPLIGYGASAILGYGLAIAALRFSR